MSKPTSLSHPKQLLLPTDIEGFDSLAELAPDMRSSLNHATDTVWRHCKSRDQRYGLDEASATKRAPSRLGVSDCDELFTKDKSVIVVYHAYP